MCNCSLTGPFKQPVQSVCVSSSAGADVSVQDEQWVALTRNLTLLPAQYHTEHGTAWRNEEDTMVRILNPTPSLFTPPFKHRSILYRTSTNRIGLQPDYTSTLSIFNTTQAKKRRSTSPTTQHRHSCIPLLVHLCHRSRLRGSSSPRRQRQDIYRLPTMSQSPHPLSVLLHFPRILPSVANARTTPHWIYECSNRHSSRCLYVAHGSPWVHGRTVRNVAWACRDITHISTDLIKGGKRLHR